MGRVKTFIATIPIQAKDRNGNDMLKPVAYVPAGNSKLEYGATRFPIIPVINGYAENGDKIRVIAIRTDGENSNKSIRALRGDVHAKQAIG